MVVTTVEKLEPLPLRIEWMNDLAQAVAFLESLNLAHGDLRPENILLDRNRLKLSDFDCTAKIGTKYEACMAPYGRLLNSSESDQGECGTSGFLGPRTEQFALGSLYYLINHGFEVYGDRCLAEDPYEHGPKTVELLQSMEFPNLDGNPLIDNIIDKCWHNKYVTVSELAAHTRMLLNERTDAIESSGSRRKESSEVLNPVETMFIERWRVVIGRIVHRICYGLGVWWRSLLQRINGEIIKAERPNGDNRDDVDQNRLGEEFLSKKKFCQDLEKRGLLHVLSSGEPEQIGFTFDWYRHSLSG
jgi:serine/threonine protein kinase